MALTLGAITKVAVAATAAAGALPGTSGKYLFTCNTDCYLRFDGDTATVSAYDIFMPKGLAVIIQPKTSLDSSVIRASADGVLSIREDKLIGSAALLLGMTEPGYNGIKAKHVSVGQVSQ